MCSVGTSGDVLKIPGFNDREGHLRFPRLLDWYVIVVNDVTCFLGGKIRRMFLGEVIE
jgi:hypothetical protein